MFSALAAHVTLHQAAQTKVIILLAAAAFVTMWRTVIRLLAVVAVAIAVVGIATLFEAIR